MMDGMMAWQDTFSIGDADAAPCLFDVILVAKSDYRALSLLFASSASTQLHQTRRPRSICLTSLSCFLDSRLSRLQGTSSCSRAFAWKSNSSGLRWFLFQLNSTTNLRRRLQQHLQRQPQLTHRRPHPLLLPQLLPQPLRSKVLVHT